MFALSFFSTPRADTQDQPKSPAGEPVTPAPGTVPAWRSLVVLGLAGLLAIGYWLNPTTIVSPQAGVTLGLPDQVGFYHGTKADFSPTELSNLPADTGLYRKDYDDFAGHQIRCSIVLSGAEGHSIHRAEQCLDGQGWDITDQSDCPIQLNSGNVLTVRSISIARQMMTQSNQKYTVHAFYIYWYVGENVTTPSNYKRVLISAWDSFFFNRAHRWAYVSVFAPVTDNLRPGGLNADQTHKMLTDFIRQCVPLIQKSEMPKLANDGT